MFPQIFGITDQADFDGKTRIFEGTGLSYIPVPNLLTLESVRIDGVEIPLTGTRNFNEMNPERGHQVIPVELAMVEVVDSPEYGKVLVRSYLSNHGIWQSGSRVAVRGEWEGDEKMPGEIVENTWVAFVPGLDRAQCDALEAAGLGTIEALKAASDEQIVACPSIGKGALAKIRVVAPHDETN